MLSFRSIVLRYSTPPTLGVSYIWIFALLFLAKAINFIKSSIKIPLTIGSFFRGYHPRFRPACGTVTPAPHHETNGAMLINDSVFVRVKFPIRI